MAAMRRMAQPTCWPPVVHAASSLQPRLHVHPSHTTPLPSMYPTAGDEPPPPPSPSPSASAPPPFPSPRPTSAKNVTLCWGELSIRAACACVCQPRQVAGTCIVASWALTCRPCLQVAGKDAFTQLGKGNATVVVLDDGSTFNEYNSSSPVQVSEDLLFAVVCSGPSHSCALDPGGNAWCWGEPVYSQHILAVFLSSCTQRAYWTYCLAAGGNDSGQLGTGSTPDSTTPVAVAGNHTFRSISCGGGHTCALDDTGRAWCWGELGSGVVFIASWQCRCVAVGKVVGCTCVSCDCMCAQTGAFWLAFITASLW